LGLAIKKHGLADTVAGYVRRPASVAECERIRAVDRATTDLVPAVDGADFVVLCTPLAQMKGLTERMLPHLKRGAIVTDVGSVKEGLVGELEPMLSAVGVPFVGSHPMAGAETMGVSHARADLFQDAVCAVTPSRTTPPGAFRKVEEFWRLVAPKPVRLTPALHDELVSRSSHLPHVVAAELANYVLSPSIAGNKRCSAQTDFAIPPASRRGRRRCGAISLWPTGGTWPECLASSSRTFRSFATRSTRWTKRRLRSFSKKASNAATPGVAKPAPRSRSAVDGTGRWRLFCPGPFGSSRQARLGQDRLEQAW